MNFRVRLLCLAAVIATVLLAGAYVGAGAAAARPGGVIRTGPNGVTGLGDWLRVGDSLAELKRPYPRGIKGPGGCAIVFSLHSAIAAGSRLDIVTASIKANRIASFQLWFGGAGD